MKIAFVANTSWNVYNFRKGLVRSFLDAGHEVLMLAPRDEYSDQVAAWGVKFIETPLDGTGSNPIKDVGYLKQLFSVFKAEKPDVSLSYTIKSNIYASIAGRLTGVKTICNVSGLGTVFLVKGLTGRIALQLYRTAFKFSNHVFFQNAEDKQLFLSKVSIDSEKTSLLPGSGINLSEFEPASPIITSPLKILMVSRVIVEKGVREYVAAAKSFTNGEAVFTLVGKFDEGHARSIGKSEFDDWVERGYIQYMPHSDKIKELMRESEVVMLPSYREGTPRTLLEGGAIGRTLMAADVPGCREVVAEGYNGYLFDAKDAESIVQKVKQYLKLSEKEKNEMATNSRKYVEEKFDEKLVIYRYKQVIDQFTYVGD